MFAMRGEVLRRTLLSSRGPGLTSTFSVHHQALCMYEERTKVTERKYENPSGYWTAWRENICWEGKWRDRNWSGVHIGCWRMLLSRLPTLELYCVNLLHVLGSSVWWKCNRFSLPYILSWHTAKHCHCKQSQRQAVVLITKCYVLILRHWRTNVVFCAAFSSTLTYVQETFLRVNGFTS